MRTEKSNYRHRRLLRPRRQRPCCCRAAEQRDELAPFHSITSSARASSAGGTASQHPDPMKTLSVSLDRLDQMLRVRIRQNFRIQAGQRGFERLPVDFCDSHA
jgi:hypothetical protein